MGGADATRQCSACMSALPPSAFSAKQLKAKASTRRCKQCVEGVEVRSVDDGSVDQASVEQASVDVASLDDWRGGLASMFGDSMRRASREKTRVDSATEALWKVACEVDVVELGESSESVEFRFSGRSRAIAVKPFRLKGKLHCGLAEEDGHALITAKIERLTPREAERRPGVGLSSIGSDAVVDAIAAEFRAAQDGSCSYVRSPKTRPCKVSQQSFSGEIVPSTAPRFRGDLVAAFMPQMGDAFDFVNDADAGARVCLKEMVEEDVAATWFAVRQPDDNSVEDVLFVAPLGPVVERENEPLFPCAWTRVREPVRRDHDHFVALACDVTPSSKLFQELPIPSNVIDRLQLELERNEPFLGEAYKTRMRDARISFIAPLGHADRVDAYRQHTARPCASCGKRPAKKTCSRCKTSPYCDADCQRRHWPQHKKNCRPPEDSSRKAAWVDIDTTSNFGQGFPTMSVSLRTPTPVFHQAREQHPEHRLKDRVFVVKCQAPTSEPTGAGPPCIMIYDKERKTQAWPDADAMATGQPGFWQLLDFIRTKGHGGEKMGVPYGLKVYARAYYTRDNLLRVFTDRPEQPQPW